MIMNISGDSRLNGKQRRIQRGPTNKPQVPDPNDTGAVWWRTAGHPRGRNNRALNG